MRWSSKADHLADHARAIVADRDQTQVAPGGKPQTGVGDVHGVSDLMHEQRVLQREAERLTSRRIEIVESASLGDGVDAAALESLHQQQSRLHDQIVMEHTLEAALMRLFEGNAPAPNTPAPGSTAAEPTPPLPQSTVPPGLSQLAAEARTHYDRAVQAQRAGDWTKYGEELRLLGELLSRMK